MTQEEQVLIRGKCFLYRQKAPFVPSGESVYGALEYNEQTDQVRCHECGQWFRQLGVHIFRIHHIRSAEYRRNHGLRRKCALCGPHMAAAIAAGNEEAYKRLRLRTQSPEGRVAFRAAVSSFTGERQRRTDTAERLNEEGHCPAQLTERLKQLHARYGRTPTSAELIENGICLRSTCLAFNLSKISEVFKFLEMVPNPLGGGYTREALIEILRDFWVKYGRVPSRAHVRMGVVPREGAFLRVFGSMQDAYEAAGLAAPTRSPYSREGLLERLREFYRQHGEAPRPSRRYGRGYGDALPPGFPSRKVFNRLFGSMSSAYEAAGLASV